MQVQVLTGGRAAKPRAQQQRRRPKRAAREHHERRLAADADTVDVPKDPGDPAVRGRDVVDVAAGDDLGSVRACVGQIRDHRRPLCAAPAAVPADAAIAATFDVPRDRDPMETERVEACGEQRFWTVLGALVRIDVDPLLDGVVMVVELSIHAIEARRGPLLANISGQPERGAPVHDGPASHGASREDREREVLGREELTTPEEAGRSLRLVAVEVRFRRERALLEDEDSAAAGRELPGSDGAAGTRSDDDHVSLDHIALGVRAHHETHGLHRKRTERGTLEASLGPERIRATGGARIGNEEREALHRLERRSTQRDRRVGPSEEVRLAVRSLELAESCRTARDGEVYEGLLDESQEQHQVVHQLWTSDGLELGNDRVGDRPRRRLRNDGLDDSRERGSLALADGHAGTAVLRLALSSAASCRRRVLPMRVFGSESRNSISFGRLNGARCFSQCARMSSAVAVAPGFRTTNALTSSPLIGCGMPIAAASITAGCVASASSTSRGYTLKPETMIISFLRSTIET